MSVKKSGLGLQNSVTSAEKKYLSSKWGRIFHRQSPSGTQRRKSGQTKIRDDANESKLKVLVNDLEAHDRRLILRAKNTGSWLSIQGAVVTVTVLAATYLRNICKHVMM